VIFRTARKPLTLRRMPGSLAAGAVLVRLAAFLRPHILGVGMGGSAAQTPKSLPIQGACPVWAKLSISTRGAEPRYRNGEDTVLYLPWA
jgi:hypothetical protein